MSRRSTRSMSITSETSDGGPGDPDAGSRRGSTRRKAKGVGDSSSSNSSSSSSSSSSSAAAPSSALVEEEEAPTKRGRGRPRRDSTASVASSTGDANEDASATAPRGRGRPRRDSTASVASSTGDANEDASTTAPRGRGRPRRDSTASVVSSTGDGNEDASATASAAKKPASGRGRAKAGAATAAPTTTTTPATTSEPAAKKRASGRQRKDSSASLDMNDGEEPKAPSNPTPKPSKKRGNSSLRTDDAPAGGDDGQQQNATAASPFDQSQKKEKRSKKARKKSKSPNANGTPQLESQPQERGNARQWSMHVHRCRFVGWMPDPIHALAALPAHLVDSAAVASSSSSSSPGGSSAGSGAATSGGLGQCVAVARAGGELELVNVDERWSVSARVPGVTPRPVRKPKRSAQRSSAVDSDDDSDDFGDDDEEDEDDEDDEDVDDGNDIRALAWVGGGGDGRRGRPRLIAATLRGLLFEADFQRGVRAHETDSLGGAVWALATPPQPKASTSSPSNGSSELVAAGCEDGTVRIFRVASLGGGEVLASDRGIEFLRTLGPVGVRVTALAWGPSPPSSSSSSSAVVAAAGGGGRVSSSRLNALADTGPLFAGTADGTIHRFHVATGRSAQRMTLDRLGTASGSGTGKSGRGGKKSRSYDDGGSDDEGGAMPVVWALLALTDGTVVSGDSDGCVQFWDGRLCVHEARIATHAADVLCLAAGSSELGVFASGIDHKVVCLERMMTQQQAASASASAPPSSSSTALSLQQQQPNFAAAAAATASALSTRWTISHAYRAHQLDVRGLAVVQLSKATAPEHRPSYGRKYSGQQQQLQAKAARREILVSGGLDTKLCTYHVRNFAEHRPKRIWPFPYHAIVSLAPGPRRLLAQHRDRLCLWQLPSRTAKQLSADYHESQLAAAAAAAEAAGLGSQSPGALAIQDPTTLSAASDGAMVPGSAGGHSLLLEMKLNTGTSLVCSAVSQRGDWIAGSDAEYLRLFHLVSTTSSSSSAAASADHPSASNTSVRVVKVRLSGAASAPCQRLAFSPGGQRLIAATQDGNVNVIALDAGQSGGGGGGGGGSGGATARLEHAFRFCADVAKSHAASFAEASGGLFSGGAAAAAAASRGGRGDLGEDDENPDALSRGGDEDDDGDEDEDEDDDIEGTFGGRSVEGLPFTGLALSPDGQWLVVAGAENNILAYSMDKMALYWTLPRPVARLTSLAFYPEMDSQGVAGSRKEMAVLNNDGLLAVTCVDNRFVLYEIEARRVADWSAEHNESFPSQLRHRADALVGAAFSPGAANRGQLLLRSHGFLCFVDLKEPIPGNARIHPPLHLAARNDAARRKRELQRKEQLQRLQAAAATKALMAANAMTDRDRGSSSMPSSSSSSSSSGKRPRANSSTSVASEASASELVTDSGGNGRRVRSDSIVSISSDHIAEAGGGRHQGLLERGSSGGTDYSTDGDGDEDDYSNNRNFAITLKYRPVIFADFLGADELVVVEEPWLKIMQKLPDPLYRQRYGT